jgi:hypothetical protein
MIVLGVNAYHGDVSAVLLRDGELVAAVEEERFRRVKHWAEFPRVSIRTCLKIAGVTAMAVTPAISRDQRANLLRKALFTLRKRPSPKLVWDRAKNSNRVQSVADTIAGVPEAAIGHHHIAGSQGKVPQALAGVLIRHGHRGEGQRHQIHTQVQSILSAAGSQRLHAAAIDHQKSPLGGNASSGSRPSRRGSSARTQGRHAAKRSATALSVMRSTRSVKWPATSRSE